MDNNGNRGTLGRVAISLFGSSLLLLVFTVVLTYLPRNNEFGSLLTWLGLLVGFSLFFLGIPMLLASLVISLIAIVKDHSKNLAYITLAGNLVVHIGIICWLFR